jgi:hypothetical protein
LKRKAKRSRHKKEFDFMEEKKFVIDKSKLWSYNEDRYTEEFCKQLREEQKKDIQESLEKLNKDAEETSKQEQVVGSALRKREEEARARGEIMDPFIEQHLEGKITAARWALALAMGMTLLFKGFWALWILFILLYNWEVKRLKREALEADMKRGKKK